MSEENKDSAPSPADMPQQKQGVDSLPEWAQKEIRDTRAEAAKYRTRSREFENDEEYQRAKDALKKLDAIEQAAKSETQRLTEGREKLLVEAEQAKSDLLRYRTAVKAGFTGDDAEDIASRLRGDDEDALLADAQKLREFFRPHEKKADPSQGKVSADDSFGALLNAELSKRLHS